MARYLIDANLPRYFSPWSGSECEFAHDMGEGWSDTDAWAYASVRKLTIVSKDADFTNRALLNLSGPKVIHMRLGNLRMRDFHESVTNRWPAICAASETNRLVAVYRDRIEVID